MENIKIFWKIVGAPLELPLGATACWTVGLVSCEMFRQIARSKTLASKNICDHYIQKFSLRDLIAKA